jgi:hypothetical protein
MDRARGMNRERGNAYRIVVQKPEGKKPLWRPWHRWVDFREIGWDEMPWTVLIWLRTATGGGLFWSWQRIFGFHKMLKSSLAAATGGFSRVSAPWSQLVTSLEHLSFATPSWFISYHRYFTLCTPPPKKKKQMSDVLRMCQQSKHSYLIIRWQWHNAKKRKFLKFHPPFQKTDAMIRRWVNKKKRTVWKRTEEVLEIIVIIQFKNCLFNCLAKFRC